MGGAAQGCHLSESLVQLRRGRQAFGVDLSLFFTILRQLQLIRSNLYFVQLSHLRGKEAGISFPLPQFGCFFFFSFFRPPYSFAPPLGRSAPRKGSGSRIKAHWLPEAPEAERSLQPSPRPHPHQDQVGKALEAGIGGPGDSSRVPLGAPDGQRT